MKRNKSKLIIAMIPVILFLLGELVCSVTVHRHIIETPLDWINLLRHSSINLIAGYALLINMGNGRMDLSLGGQKLVACILGGNIALALNFPAWGVLLMCVLFGVLAGLVTGLLYVTFRLPAMILGIGVALIFESITAAYSPNGFQLFGRSGMGLLSNVWFITACAVIVAVAMWILLERSRFGIHYKAMSRSQKIAKTSGIKIYSRTVVCYVLCGALIGLSAVLETGVNGYMSTSMNLTSISIAFTSFVPVFAAMVMQRWISTVFGLPIAVVSFRILAMVITVFRVPTAASSVITMAMLVVLLIVMNVVGMVDHKRKISDRIAEAKQALDAA